MAKPGRKPTLLPPGVRRRELKRHEIRIWLKDAPDDPPTIHSEDEVHQARRKAENVPR